MYGSGEICAFEWVKECMKFDRLTDSLCWSVDLYDKYFERKCVDSNRSNAQWFSDSPVECNSTWDFPHCYGSFLTRVSLMLNTMLLRSLRLLLSLVRVRKCFIRETYYCTAFTVLFFLRPSVFLFLQGVLYFTANNISVTCKQRSYDYYKRPLRVKRSYTPHTGREIKRWQWHQRTWM